MSITNLFHDLFAVPAWVSTSFPIIQAALVILIAIACIVMIVAILASPANVGRGANAITGASESYYTKNKGKSNQGRIRNLIIVCAVTIAISAILYFVLIQIFQGQGGLTDGTVPEL